MAERTMSGPGQRSTTAEFNTELVALERHIEALSQAAAVSADELRRANAAKDEFVGLVSHELRTPITVILGNAAVLLKSMKFENESHYSALLDIRSEAERLNRLVSNMLVLAKLDGSPRLDIEPALIGPAVVRVAAEHQRRYPKRRLNMQMQDAGTPCLAVESYVEQIVANLLSNAEKYSATEEEIDLNLRRDGGRLVICVADRGTGMNPADVERFFDALGFGEGSSSITGGIGIGLAACKRLVDAQEGAIWARRRDGGGSEVGFSLRVAEAGD